MEPSRDLSMIFSRLPGEAAGPAIDVLGPTVEFLIQPSPDDDAALCVLRGVIAAGLVIPMHSHDDPEDFYILAGTKEVLTQRPGGLEWAQVQAGDYVHVAPGTMHAHRNLSDGPAAELIITTARLGRFFREIGRPATGGPPDPQRAAQLVEAAVRYGYTLGTPEQNAAAGIELPKFSG